MPASETKRRLEHATAVARWALRSESAPRINAMIDMARSEPGVGILPEQLDRDPMLLNCLNGTLDLQTGTLREHRREDYLTKLCPVEYDANAQAPLWSVFLATILGHDADLIRYVQRVCGYCLTGDVREQILLILWGTGANGKSTFVNTIGAMLGDDYAIKASRDLFMARKQDNHPAQLARLFGKRLVVCVETHEGARLDEGLIKELTGGDPITARRMREDPWQFNPTHKAVLVTNHRPEIRGTDHAIWRRVRLIPFTVTIADDKQDKDLSSKLRDELPGILAWCVRGCLDWQRDGLEAPAQVLAATKSYRDEQDVLAAFVDELCLTGADYSVKASELYGTFRAWCKRSGEEDVSQRRFGQAMTEKGFERYTNNGKWYRGVAVRPEFRDGQNDPP